MKNWKQIFTVMAFTAIFGFVGCGGETGTDEFTVTFDLDGGNIDGVTTSVKITVKSGEKVTNLPNPKKTGYILGGWFAERNGIGNEFTSATAVSASVTVFAKWVEQPKKQTITLTGLFEKNEQYPEGFSATITCFCTDTEWEGTEENPGIYKKIETALNAAFNAGGNPVKNRFRGVFDPENNTKGKVEFTVEDGVDYDSYEIDDSANIRWNFDYLSDVSDDDLQTAVSEAVQEMNKLI